MITFSLRFQTQSNNRVEQLSSYRKTSSALTGAVMNSEPLKQKHRVREGIESSSLLMVTLNVLITWTAS